MVNSAAAVWLNTVFADFDLNLTLLIHSIFYPLNGFFTPFFEFISFLGKAGIVLILVSALLLLYKKYRKCGSAMLLALLFGVILTNCVFKVLIARARPYADTDSVFYQLWQLVNMNTESDKSFPSGHATAAFAAMIPICILGKKPVKYTSLIFSVLMMIARVYLVVHFPTDVIAGAIVGTIAGVLGVFAANMLPHKWYELTFIKRDKEPAHVKH